MKSLLARVGILGLVCVAISQAAPVSLGFISFNNAGASGQFTAFHFNNWTNDLVPGYPVVTAVTFMSASLSIDRVGAPPDQAVAVPISMAPGFASYTSDFLNSSYQITRAVFRATLGPSDTWTLTGGAVFVPETTNLEIVLLPGPAQSHLVPNSFDASWDIVVNGHTPEPATMALSAAGLLGLLLAAHCRRK